MKKVDGRIQIRRQNTEITRTRKKSKIRIRIINFLL